MAGRSLLPGAWLFIRSVICVQRSDAAKVVFVDLLLDWSSVIFPPSGALRVRHPDPVFLSYFSVIKGIVITTHRQSRPGRSRARAAARGLGLLAACASASADAGKPCYPATERPDDRPGRALCTDSELAGKAPLRPVEGGLRGRSRLVRDEPNHAGC